MVVYSNFLVGIELTSHLAFAYIQFVDKYYENVRNTYCVIYHFNILAMFEGIFILIVDLFYYIDLW